MRTRTYNIKKKSMPLPNIHLSCSIYKKFESAFLKAFVEIPGVTSTFYAKHALHEERGKTVFLRLPCMRLVPALCLPCVILQL